MIDNGYGIPEDKLSEVNEKMRSGRKLLELLLAYEMYISVWLIIMENSFRWK